jgi:amino acid adenylation domain-containing protein
MKNSVINFLYDTVRKYPDKTCAVDEGESLTFKQLFLRAYRLSEALKLSNKINQPIVVYLPKNAMAIVSFAGVLMSGNFYVPIDLKSPQKRLQNIIEHLCPLRVVSLRRYREDLKELLIQEDKIISLEDILSCNDDYSIEKVIENSRKITNRIIDMDPCYVIHTSGSTGVPKGAVISHRGVIDYIEWAIQTLKVNENEIIGNQSPLFFDNSTLDIYLCWATGSELHLISEGLFIFPIKLIEYLEKYKISFIFFVPSVLVNIAKMKLLSPMRLPKLKKVIFAGEVMPTKHLTYWQENLPDRLYINLYGPTEITVDCTYFIVDRKYEPYENLPIGFPCNNSDILILNEKNLPAEAGEQGELCVRGSSLALGYWNDDAKTEQVFTQNPLQKNYFDRIYRTGDIVYKNERGEIIFVGRKDSQIKHMGYRIELGEIESAIMALHKADKCCVLYNEQKQEIAAFYEAKEEIAISEFNRNLVKLLPKYMLPRKFYYLEKLPINPNGKIDRKVLQDKLS